MADIDHEIDDAEHDTDEDKTDGDQELGSALPGEGLHPILSRVRARP